mgnify:CR=1 FL=1
MLKALIALYTNLHLLNIMDMVMRMDSDINYIIQESLKGDKIYAEILLKRLNPLIFKNIYTRYSPSDPFIQDLQQEGYIMVLQSLKDFDPGRNVHFLQYIKVRLTYFYKNYFSKSTKDKTLSLDDLREAGKEIISEGMDQVTSVLIKEEKEALHRCIDELTEKEQMILKLFYFKELSIQEISETLNMKYRSVINTKSYALNKLRRKMSKFQFQ